MTTSRWPGCLALGWLVLAGCQPAVVPAQPQPAGLAYAAAEAGQPLPAGTVAGFVGRLEHAGYVPAAGVAVAIAGTARTTLTDGDGFYRFDGVPGEQVTLGVADPRFHPFSLGCRLNSVYGTPRVNLPLVPVEKPDWLPAGTAIVAGVVTDPRGAALPGGTVHLVDSLSERGKGGSRRWTADAFGFFACELGGLATSYQAPGAGSLTAYGVTPGGVRVESTSVTAMSLDGRPTYAVHAGTTAFQPARSPVLVEAAPALVLTASSVPTRLDELVVRFEGEAEAIDVAPQRLEGGRVTVLAPTAWRNGQLRLLTLGAPAPAAYDTALKLTLQP